MKQKKKKIAALSLAALVAGTGAFHAYGNYQQSGESDALLNENILALSSEGEDGESGTCHAVDCYSSLVYKAGASVVDCGTCESLENHTDKWYCLKSSCCQYY